LRLNNVKTFFNTVKDDKLIFVKLLVDGLRKADSGISPF